MDYLKLRSNQLLSRKFLQKTDVMNIRVIHIPYGCGMNYYPKQNVLALIDYKKIGFHKIIGNQLENIEDSSLILNPKGFYGQKQEKAFFFENSILVFSLVHLHFRIFKIDNLSEPKILKCQLPKDIDIDLCSQIHRNNFIIGSNYLGSNRLVIYSMRNLKKSRQTMRQNMLYYMGQWSLWEKLQIRYVKQNGFLIQAVVNKCLYFYTTKMRKQIRKFDGFEEKEPNFDTNFIIIPFYEQFGTKWIQTYLNIYDISSMKVKGVIKTRAQSEQSYESSVFIKRLNVIAIMYAQKLVLFEMSSLKQIGSEKIQHHGRQQIMRYDDENGLIIFIKKNNVEIQGYEN